MHELTNEAKKIERHLRFFKRLAIALIAFFLLVTVLQLFSVFESKLFRNTSVEQARNQVLAAMQQEEEAFAAFSQTDDFERFRQTSSKDSIAFYHFQFHRFAKAYQKSKAALSDSL